MKDKIKENLIYEPFTSLDEQRAAEEKIKREVEEIINDEEFEQEELRKEVEKELEKYKKEIDETYELFNLNKEKELSEIDTENEYIDFDDIDGEEYESIELEEDE